VTRQHSHTHPLRPLGRAGTVTRRLRRCRSRSGCPTLCEGGLTSSDLHRTYLSCVPPVSNTLECIRTFSFPVKVDQKAAAALAQVGWTAIFTPLSARLWDIWKIAEVGNVCPGQVCPGLILPATCRRRTLCRRPVSDGRVDRADTLHKLADASGDDHTHDLEREVARRSLAECDQRLARYRAALEAGTDPALIARWTAEVNAQRAMAQQRLRQAAGTTRMTPAEIPTLVTAIGDLIGVLRTADPADPADKVAVYRHLGLKLTYRQEAHTLRVRSQPNLSGKGFASCPRGNRPRVRRAPAANGCACARN
jgi:hypothetical protein